MKIEVKMAKTKTMKWISAIKENLAASGITTNKKLTIDRKTFRFNVFDRKVGQREKRKKTGTVWSGEEKRPF